MTTGKVETLAWVAIYIGLALIGLGVSLDRHDAGFGWSVAIAGGLGVVVGAILIWLRSRMRDGT